MARLAEKARPAGQGRRSALAELDRAAQQHRAADRPAQRRPARRAEISAMRAVRISVARRAAHAARTRYFALVELTLERICEGGIYDHLGGGFSRYSVDERWLVPHFEKMLYDNAQLLELLALAHRALPAMPLFRERAQRNRRLARARDDDAGGRVLAPRSMPIPKARRASSTSGRCAEIEQRARRRGRGVLRSATTT